MGIFRSIQVEGYKKDEGQWATPLYEYSRAPCWSRKGTNRPVAGMAWGGWSEVSARHGNTYSISPGQPSATKPTQVYGQKRQYLYSSPLPPRRLLLHPSGATERLIGADTGPRTAVPTGPQQQRRYSNGGEGRPREPSDASTSQPCPDRWPRAASRLGRESGSDARCRWPPG